MPRAAHTTAASTALAVAALAAGLAGCGNGHAGVHGETAAVPARPDGCRDVAPGELAAALAAAAPGDALCLAVGTHDGALRVPAGVTVWGPRDAIIRASQPGTIVTVAGAGARLAGFTIDATGGRFEVLDSAVHVIADDVVVEGLVIERAVYGILVERARRVTVRGNHVKGDTRAAHGMRGDTIRLWETHDSLVEGNLVEDGRDVVVWYSRGNRVTGNRIHRGRYGTHLMYSHDTVIEDNRYFDGVVGVFVMYSRRVTLRRNAIAGAAGAAGLAIGLKDSGDLVVEHNLLVHDAIGIYIDQAPGGVNESLYIRGNVIRQCDAAVSLHTSPQRTVFADNDLADNTETVRVAAGLQPTTAVWRGNYFDDYAGYDLDGDGTGDLRHEARSTTAAMIGARPELAFFRGTAALGVVDAATTLLPLWRPQVLLVDEAPRMAPRDPQEVLHAR